MAKLEQEDLFGFHSEYHVEDYLFNGFHPGQGSDAGYGYSKYADYQGYLYFLKDYAEGVVIVKCNPDEQNYSVVKIKTKEKYSYIAVNRRGYFLYNKQKVVLYGFDGTLFHSHKYAVKSKYGNDITTCVYVYDSKFYYAETKSTGRHAIVCVDMVDKTSREIWKAEKGDDVLEGKLREEYFKHYKTEYPERAKITNISFYARGCAYLYANGSRVVAGFSRIVNYSVNIQLDADGNAVTWDVLECKKERKGMTVFSFDMLHDSMWVQYDEVGSQKRIFNFDICRLSDAHGKILLNWKMPRVNQGYIYFDGKNAFNADYCTIFEIKNDGEKVEKHVHEYQTSHFYVLGKWKITSNYGGWANFYDGERRESYSINYLLESDLEAAPVLAPPKEKKATAKPQNVSEQNIPEQNTPEQITLEQNTLEQNASESSAASEVKTTDDVVKMLNSMFGN